ncbi:UPF0545 protein C22orf39 homolog [Contarinia nasturtii]|uniref:UPF0545 protein C22orf39 homolog n=1 Tax=Contarinia nasturtii TaxID=265458 RepID=UPI0012D46836|nr:UPF0545 protein C22orf39 homolog [Contarinia nasturtii]
MSENNVTQEQTVVNEKKVKHQEIYDKYSEWIRPCSIYKDEFKECKSFKGRFNQYYVFGEYLNCDQWRDDYNNCQKHSWFDDKEAGTSVIQSELSRRAARLKAHYDNDVWTKREHPPSDWNKPLPAFLAERSKYSYLTLKATELNEEEQLNAKSLSEPNKSSFCTFM